MRSLKKKNFWIMEQTAGPGGWGVYGRNPRPGEIRKIAFQQVAHGADHIIHIDVITRLGSAAVDDNGTAAIGLAQHIGDDRRVGGR